MKSHEYILEKDFVPIKMNKDGQAVFKNTKTGKTNFLKNKE